MTVETTLEKAFLAYLNLARAELRPRQVKPPSPRPFELLRNRSMELRHLVDRTEMSSEFGDFVKQTLVAFPPKDPAFADSCFSKIQNFFRRSRCYTSIYSGKDVDIGATFRDLIAEFRKRQIQIRWLVPLSSIQFGDELMEFKEFQIRHFSAEELDEILQNDVSEVFYEWNTVDVSKIEGYWFIDLIRFESASYETWTPGSLEFNPSLYEEFSAFPKIIAIVLEPLILYDWDSERIRAVGGPNSLDIPFVLEIADDLLHAPRSVPALPTFEVEGPVEDSEEVEFPHYRIDMDDLQSASLIFFVNHVDSVLTRLRSAKSEWHFLEVALVFLSKAFFSEGLQQLLWHVTVLEALLGEDEGRLRPGPAEMGLTARLRERLALVLGRTAAERTETRKSFNDVYKLRSRLVHGGEKLLDQKTQLNHLREARNLARRTFVWFLHYLDHVLDQSRNQRALPTREELLSVLDRKIQPPPQNLLVDFGPESRERIKHLLKILPADFPQTSSWFLITKEAEP